MIRSVGRMLAVSVCVFALASCGNELKAPDEVGKSPEDDKAFVTEALATLPEDKRAALTEQLAAIESQAAASLKTALASKDAGDLAHLAFETRETKAKLAAIWTGIIVSEKETAPEGAPPEPAEQLMGSKSAGEIANRFQNPGPGIKIHPSDKVLLLKSMAVISPMFDKLKAANPVVPESLKRLDRLEAGLQTSQQAGNIARDIIRNEPCFAVATQQAAVIGANISGVKPGMTRAQAIQALCSSSKKEIKLVGEPQILTAPSNTWLENRNGDYWAELLAFNSTNGDMQRAISQEFKPYTVSETYCLDCEAKTQYRHANDASDKITIYYLPNGTVAGIERGKKFEKKVQVAGYSGALEIQTRTTPTPLNQIVSAYIKSAGNPTFTNAVADGLYIGWATDASGKALPENHWTGQGKATSLNGKPINLSNNTRDWIAQFGKALASENVQSTYCMGNVPKNFAQGTGAQFLLYGMPLDSSAWYYRRDAERMANFGADIVKSAGGKPKDVGNFSASGKTDQCGTVMLLGIKLFEGERDETGQLKLTPDMDEALIQGKSAGASVLAAVQKPVPVEAISTLLFDIGKARAFLNAQDARIRARKAKNDSDITKQLSGQSDFVP
jgi:hypothetical protein